MSNKGGRKENDFVSKYFNREESEESVTGVKSSRYFYSCNFCPQDRTNRILHRDTRLAGHIVNECAQATTEAREAANLFLMRRAKAASKEEPLSHIGSGATETTEDLGQESESARASGKRKRQSAMEQRLLDSFLERQMSEDERVTSNMKLLRFMVHGNIPFNLVNSPLFDDFLKSLRKTYSLPSRDTLTMTLLPAEMARVRMLETARLKEQKFLTLMTDGWDDAQNRSLYGTVAAERGKYPTILGLENMTGKRANASNIKEVVRKSMGRMSVEPSQIIAMVTDDPSVMGAVRRDLEQEFPWIIMIACFEHKLNGLVGKVSGYSDMKPIISKNVRMVTFFRSSHYWGGELDSASAKLGIKRKLKKHGKTPTISILPANRGPRA